MRCAWFWPGHVLVMAFLLKVRGQHLPWYATSGAASSPRCPVVRGERGRHTARVVESHRPAYCSASPLGVGLEQLGDAQRSLVSRQIELLAAIQALQGGRQRVQANILVEPRNLQACRSRGALAATGARAVLRLTVPASHHNLSSLCPALHQ